jgi:hypothetical protein
MRNLYHRFNSGLATGNFGDLRTRGETFDYVQHVLAFDLLHNELLGIWIEYTCVWENELTEHGVGRSFVQTKVTLATI